MHEMPLSLKEKRKGKSRKRGHRKKGTDLFFTRVKVYPIIDLSECVYFKAQPFQITVTGNSFEISPPWITLEKIPSLGMIQSPVAFFMAQPLL